MTSDDLPPRWSRMTMAQVLRTLPNGRLIEQGWSPQCNKQSSSDNATWGVLKTTAIQPGEFLGEHNKRLPDDLTPKSSIEVLAGDLLLTCAGPRARCAIPCLVRATRPRLMISGKMYRFRADESVMDPRFLELFLLCPAAQKSLDAMKTGISDSGLNLTQSRFLGLGVVVPPLEEQRRIVDILEDHFSRLDAAALSLTSALLRLRVLHRSVLMGLIPDISAYPAHWSKSTVAEAGNVALGRQRHPDWHAGPNMRPYLRVANVFEDRIDVSDVMQMHWPDDSFERFRLKPGDVLLNEGQSPEYLGRPAIYRGEPVDIAFTNTLIRFQAYDHVSPEFALLVFRRHMHAGRFARESRITTNIAHLSASRLKPIEFPLPALDEQKYLVGLAEQQLGDAARLREQVRLLEVRNKALRRALLGAAFAGRLTGRTTDMEVVEEMAGV